jgi:hypothetical protein
MRTDERADMREVIGAFSEYANEPNNPSFDPMVCYIVLMGLGTTSNYFPK